METELTRRLKELCRSYKPRIPTSLRTICWAEEVPAGDGIVDVIRFEDEYSSSETACTKNGGCLWESRKEDGCRGCIYASRRYGSVRPLCTCYKFHAVRTPRLAEGMKRRRLVFEGVLLPSLLSAIYSNLLK